MSVKVRFLGTAAVEIITADNKRVLTDPFLDENPVSPIKADDIEQLDLLIVTHSAYDHLGDAEKIMKNLPDLPLICGADVRGYLMARGIDEARLVAVPWGMMVRQGGVKVRPVYSRHWSYIQSAETGASYSSIPLGIIVYADDDCPIYNAGDTCIYSDMKLYGELYKPRLGFINVGVPEQHVGRKHGAQEYLTGEMDAKEAALAAEWWGLEYAIPVHHDNVELPAIVEFEKLLTEKHRQGKGPKPVILAPGEWFELD
jgi:L-ascorbate metabolism protein UlaG (beta-lactamase superfamily)